MTTASDADLAAAVRALARGGVLLYPTETVYGFGCDAGDRSACARIAALKGWPAPRPMLVLVRDLEGAEAVGEVTPVARALAEAFWPGPLTLVIPEGSGSTVGVRVSPHPVVRQLLDRIGGPITSTSANRTGAAPPRTVGEASWCGDEGPDAVLDGGACAGAVGSTVVNCAGAVARVLRAGDLPVAELMSVVEVADDG